MSSCKRIDSIFIFCYRLQRYDCLRNRFPKLVDIYNCHDQLFNNLNQTIKQLRDHLQAFSLFDPKTRVRHLNFTSAEFFWFLLLKNALANFPNDEKSKQDMIKQCRSYYRGKTKQLEDIDEFEQTYHPDHAIHWYSRPLFVSHLVNKALRTEAFDLLYTFRFFILDLSRNIRALAAKQSSKHQEILHLRRGLTLSNDEIDKLISNIGNYISPNGFMSASRCSKVADIYGTNVIFEIEVDTSLNVCADIKEESAFPIEKEVVFDLGSVFRIDDVSYDEQCKRMLIKLTAVPKSEEFTENILQLNGTNCPEIFFGELIYLMENYEQAKRYFGYLKQEYSKQKFRLINQNEFFKIKLKCQKDIPKISDKRLMDSSLVLVIIAEVYQMTGNHTKAMEHLQTVLDTLANTLPNERFTC